MQEVSAMVDEKTIDKAVQILLQAAPAGSEVILFGSYARGDATEESDLDFLVVEPILESRRDEMVRLRNVLRALRVPVDVLVVSRGAFENWKDKPNNVIFNVTREGRSFGDAAAQGQPHRVSSEPGFKHYVDAIRC
jgi:predicted nucleotidyltransferase